jgi:ribonuclease HI
LAVSDKVIIFTDGACKGNPGPGGWAAVLKFDGQEKIVSGHDPRTTNNRMELMGAIKGLEAAPADREIILLSDSSYVVNTMTRGWRRNANHDLWERLDRACRDRKVTWKWVRGHQGTPGNEQADAIASREAKLASGGGPSSGKPSRPSSKTPSRSAVIRGRTRRSQP